MSNVGRQLLEHVYDKLSSDDQALLDAVPDVRAFSERGGDVRTWTDCGDWLDLANRLGAEKVLFLRDQPVVVFGEALTLDEAEVARFYRRAWCMSEPRCLFLAMPDELRLYILDRPPGISGIREAPWHVLRDAGAVGELLQSEDPFGLGWAERPRSDGAPLARADQRLIRDLRLVRDRLLKDAAISLAGAHSLIGRSILVRYLEDRQILTRSYFEEVAKSNQMWRRLLSDPANKPVLAAGPVRERSYDNVLLDASFTEALFRRLASDFNGDLFAVGDEEGVAVAPEALRLLRKFLLGGIEDEQERLFFWAYDFDVVPLSLISSLYEQFYHDERESEARIDQGSRLEDDARGEVGTHYTPASLVHDTLQRVLTPEILRRSPRVLDPACGSGIFLVEAFRRIVRYESHVQGGKLDASALRSILRDRLVGVEVNPEAARVAAFSLYIAMLDQQEPSDVLAGPKLPHLIFAGGRDAVHYGTIFANDVFFLTKRERAELRARIAKSPRYVGRRDDLRLLSVSGVLDLPCDDFDVVVGNPPWEEAGHKSAMAMMWAAAFKLSVGEGALSQLFIHRSLSLTRYGGIVALLVSAKVLWNDRDTSRAFRRHVLTRTTVRQVINMAHVRRAFFAGAIAPFVLMILENREPGPSVPVVLWNARRTRARDVHRSIATTQLDRRVVRQGDLLDADYLWKTYWWGSHRDAALVGRLAAERTLGDVVKGVDPAPAYGWQRGTIPPAGALARLPELGVRAVRQFGPLVPRWFLPPPTGIKRDPDHRLYSGPRLIITHGIKNSSGPIVRLEDTEFTFRHSFYCIPLPHLGDRDRKLLLGILWSSLARYRLFMTSGSWAGWHEKVTADDLLSTPVRLEPSWGMPAKEFERAVERIVAVVDGLRSLSSDTAHLLTFSDGVARLGLPLREQAPLVELDNAVFDLFELSQAERDLVEDFWAQSHDLLANGPRAQALVPPTLPPALVGTAADLGAPQPQGDLRRYLSAFLDFWNPQLESDQELAWQVAAGPRSCPLAVAFVPIERGSRPPQSPQPTVDRIVAQTGEALTARLSDTFRVGRVIRVASDDGFVFVKEGARRLWTASLAREDAEAVLLHLSRPRGRASKWPD